ncbi:fungal-specific transcription factor domain-containing protein [Rostrohypoxylon terebratum]|nr:fungal-specific transcription factor domain-containing protein [Rostrohypoxylon terebratum]
MEQQRKACDLCYRKKIKCDGQSPRCSACVVYNSDCTFQAASRKTPSRKQAAAQRHLKEDALQSRVKSLETQLDLVLQKVENLEKLSSCRQDTATPTPPDASEGRVILANQTLGAPHLELPPYHDVVPIVESYIANFNSIFPLFHPETLLQDVRSWYRDPHLRDPIPWAMINVVLALGLRTSRPGEITPIGSIEIYLNNAQSVLTQVIMCETTLMNIQILLGIVILFWTADDLRPALVLITTALRLSHQLGFHSRKFSGQLDQVAVLQQNRVFWIAYILDRDISLNCKLAPIQLDSEIELDLPPIETTDDHTGFVFAPDGREKLNFFRARVELAMIQGKVYECAYSASAQKFASKERSQKARQIFGMLDDWTSKISPVFSASTLRQASAPALSRYFCILYSARLSCRTLISYASAWDSFHYSIWMGNVQDYGKKVVEGQAASEIPIPQKWQELVSECREYMRLYATVVPSDDFFVKMTLCGYNSSLITLTANRIFEGRHGIIELDMNLTKSGMLYLEDLVKQTGRKMLQHTWDSIIRLRSYADLIVHSSRLSTSSSADQLDGDLQSNFLELLESHQTTDQAAALHFGENWTPSDTGTWEMDQI